MNTAVERLNNVGAYLPMRLSLLRPKTEGDVASAETVFVVDIDYG